MIVKTIKVSDKGQIAIPQTIREQAGIKKGDELVIFESNGKILIEKSHRVSAKMKDHFKDLMRFSEQALKDVWGNKQDDIWNNYLKISKTKI
ncbi:AbrB/MazE/SpoVT family DNA-binding domain-containing protein [Candidatus Woesearchaeota archaeon]|nr:AbrB/MazE/SpoVT family DNA-binding domain-containing protein [Candidatus Woesearchaeota archaeon]